jgi:hypothetical protein
MYHRRAMSEPASHPDPSPIDCSADAGGADRLAPLPPAPQFRTAWWQRLVAEGRDSSWELTRFAVLRLLALVYLVAFSILAMQMEPLIGSHGLLPVVAWLPRVRDHFGVASAFRVPTLFWLGSSDAAMRACCAAGIALSAAALLGVTNAVVQLALWALYMSFVHVGQIFYGYGWEIQLLETGFLAVFLCPVRGVRPLPRTRVPVVTTWLLRWLVFRVMVGAALIKLRGDSCWRDLTCLDHHFETQPNPNPLAWSMHHAPHAAHALGVLFNHFVELVVPWFAFGFRRARHAAGALLVFFQATLIATGNLSFLNWLTIVPALACFDDTAWLRLVPRRFVPRLIARIGTEPPARSHRIAAGVYAVAVCILSAGPVINLFSDRQVMNTSFDPLDLVNTYGAFGSVDRERYEVILEGTRDEPSDPLATWQEYELPCMPGDVRRRPCVVTPYHLRLDWQMWFVGNAAAQGESIEQNPWLVHLVWQLLEGNPSPRGLFARDPFADAPPRYVRAGIWHYAFSPDHAGGRWWDRERVGEYLPPVSLEHRGLREYVGAYGW